MECPNRGVCANNPTKSYLIPHKQAHIVTYHGVSHQGARKQAHKIMPQNRPILYLSKEFLDRVWPKISAFSSAKWGQIVTCHGVSRQGVDRPPSRKCCLETGISQQGCAQPGVEFNRTPQKKQANPCKTNRWIYSTKNHSYPAWLMLHFHNKNLQMVSSFSIYWQNNVWNWTESSDVSNSPYSAPCSSTGKNSKCSWLLNHAQIWYLMVIHWYNNTHHKIPFFFCSHPHASFSQTKNDILKDSGWWANQGGLPPYLKWWHHHRVMSQPKWGVSCAEGTEKFFFLCQIVPISEPPPTYLGGGLLFWPSKLTPILPQRKSWLQHSNHGSLLALPFWKCHANGTQLQILAER